MLLGCARVQGGADTPPGAGGAAGSKTDVGARPAACGDAQVDAQAGEVCDDGNTKSGDGCSSDCKTIEKDYACPTAGKPCTYLVRCGDGVLGGIEQCDPPNVGHGCSTDCRIEPGYVCSLPPTPANPSQPSTCHKTVCGDGVREGAEACDDGNVIDGDGCASSCTFEPNCTSGTCASKCGDGLKLPPEGCDDGNTADADGCSHDCMV